MVGHATNGHTAIAAHYNHRKHVRVVLLTDDQMHDAAMVALAAVPVIYTVDLAGYRPRSLPAGVRGRYTLPAFLDLSLLSRWSRGAQQQPAGSAVDIS